MKQTLARCSWLLLLLPLLVLSALAADRPPKPDFRPTADYRPREIHGWKVLVDPQLLADRNELGEKVLELLTVKLYDINRAVPQQALEKLHAIPIWVELSDKGVRCACYHPSKEWLASHGYNPDKAGAVEIGNAATFLQWTHEQPYMVLHELTHGYHDRFLGGYGNPEIAAVYQRAKEARLYDSVLYFNGQMKRAYALNNPQEYLAELTEAWFGTNDFYPFVRAEVLKHDTEAAKLLKKLWGE